MFGLPYKFILPSIAWSYLFHSISAPQQGLEVFVYQEDRSRIIARGTVSQFHYNSLDGINVTPTRVLVDVQEVYVPGAIIVTHRGHPLSSFGDTPFPVICRKTQVYTFVESFVPVTRASTAPVKPAVTHSESQDFTPSFNDESRPNPDRNLQPLSLGFEDNDMPSADYESYL